MITSEVKTLPNPAILQMDGGRRQQEIHLRLFLSNRRKEIFHGAPARRVGVATSVHVLSARRSNSYKNSANHASLSASFRDSPANGGSNELPITAQNSGNARVINKGNSAVKQMQRDENQIH